MTLVEENSEKGVTNREESSTKIDKTPICRKSTFQDKEKLNELVWIAGPDPELISGIKSVKRRNNCSPKSKDLSYSKLSGSKIVNKRDHTPTSSLFVIGNYDKLFKI